MTTHQRLLGMLMATLALLAGLAGPAGAESTTVTGTGDIQKMSVNNAQNAVVAKVYGPDIECGVSRWVQIVMRDKDGTRYTAKGGCYPGGVWIQSLERNGVVSCSGDKLTYNSTGGFWRFQVPRSCLSKLADRIKVVDAELVSASPMGGMAGPTAWLSRG
jgi:hypothetical protein